MDYGNSDILKPEFRSLIRFTKSSKKYAKDMAKGHSQDSTFLPNNYQNGKIPNVLSETFEERCLYFFESI